MLIVGIWMMTAHYPFNDSDKNYDTLGTMFVVIPSVLYGIELLFLCCMCCGGIIYISSI